MKKFIAIILSILIFNISPASVYAQATDYSYSRILTEDTGFYSDAGGNYLKFYLPYGYFVKILEVGPTYTKVCYMNDNSQFPLLSGYIKTVDLIPRYDTPISPYPLLNLTVISDDVLFSDSALTISKIGVYANSLAVYYGELSSGDTSLVYVYCNGYLGYMRKICFAPFTVPTHPEPIITSTSSEQSSNSAEEKTKTNSTDNLQILIVAGISVIVVSIVYLVFRPGEKRVKENSYDEE